MTQCDPSSKIEQGNVKAYRKPSMMHEREARSMLWRFALLLMVACRAWACMCGATWQSVKQAWKAAPAVFLGTVQLADPDQDGSQTIFQAQFVRIRVDEAFKGVSKGQMIELHQGGSDCDAKFRTSQRAVFYLHGAEGKWLVAPCSHALGNAEAGGNDLLFLRRLPKSAIGTRLSGEAEFYEQSRTEGFRRVAGIPGVRIKISGPNGYTEETRTNAAGAYEIYGLRPGTYSVSIIEVPRGLKIRFPTVTGSAPVPGDNAGVQISADGDASVSFALEADTRLSGRILNSKGAPVPHVCLDLEPLEGRSENGASFFTCSKEKDGTFSMEMMPP